MYNVTGKARARKNIKILQKVLNNFKYPSWGFMEILVRWTQISSNTDEKPKIWSRWKPCSVAGKRTGGALAVGGGGGGTTQTMQQTGDKEQSLLW